MLGEIERKCGPPGGPCPSQLPKLLAAESPPAAQPQLELQPEHNPEAETSRLAAVAAAKAESKWLAVEERLAAEAALLGVATQSVTEGRYLCVLSAAGTVAVIVAAGLARNRQQR